MEKLPLSKRRLTVELRDDQVYWFRDLPYGTRKLLMQAVVDDLIAACQASKFDVIGALMHRKLLLKMSDDGKSLLLHNGTIGENDATEAPESLNHQPDLS